MSSNQIKHPAKAPPSEERSQTGRPNSLSQEPVLRQDERLKRPLNSMRSGGPRTSEGRARSSLNAIKHGGYVTAKTASTALLALKDELTIRICPVGAAEESIIESLALELYRLSMLGKLEVERLLAATTAEVSLIELAQALSYPWARTHLEALRSPPSLSTLKARLVDFFQRHLDDIEGQKDSGLSRGDRLTAGAVNSFIEDIKNGQLDAGHEPDYLETVDSHMLALGTGNLLLADSMALAVDLQPLVDYWLFRNSQRIEATRRDLQVGQMTAVLTDQQVGRARDLAHKHVQQCIGLLELLQAKPINFGSKNIRGEKPLEE